MASNKAQKLLMISAIILLSIDSFASMPVQEIKIVMNVSPKDVTIVGDLYFNGEDTNRPLPCGDGIPLVYSIKLEGDHEEGRAKNDAYDVHLTAKLPYEAELVQIEEIDPTSASKAVPPYSADNKCLYYTTVDDIVYVSFDSIPHQDFPKEIRIETKVPKSAAPSAFYASALLRSANDIDDGNNYASTNSYFGIAYSRKYGREEFEKLLNEN